MKENKKNKTKRIDHLLAKPAYACNPTDDEALHFELNVRITSPKLDTDLSRKIWCWRNKDIDKNNFEKMFDHLTLRLKQKLVAELFKEQEEVKHE